MASVLKTGGKTLLSFRDYSAELKGDKRFIPVKSDDNRILTCVLDYEKETVRVTDLVNEKTDTGWKQRVSSYNKVRISAREVISFLERSGMEICFSEVDNGMTNVIGVRR